MQPNGDTNVLDAAVCAIVLWSYCCVAWATEVVWMLAASLALGADNHSQRALPFQIV